MRKIISIICSVMMSATLVACNSGEKSVSNIKVPSENEGTRTLKIAHTSAESTPVGQGLNKFRDLIKEKTKGRYSIQVYNNGQLGGERDAVESTQLGIIDMTICNQGPLSNFGSEVSNISAVDIPYIIRSYEHADKVFNGEVGNLFSQQLEKVNLKSLGIWEVGFRNLTNSKKQVNTVEDVKGLRIRTMENKAHQEMWGTLGADPVPMSWGEAYTAMQQGAIDGQENPSTIILANNVAEVNNQLAVTEHAYSTVFLLMSPKVWDSLNEEDKKIFLECAKEAGIYEREVQRKMAEESIKELEARGMTVTYPDKNKFIESTEEFRKEFGSQYIELIEKIESTK